MDFYAVLDQVLALLRQRGRVSYRALKRQFDLDDAYLDDLKVEIIEVAHICFLAQWLEPDIKGEHPCPS